MHGARHVLCSPQQSTRFWSLRNPLQPLFVFCSDRSHAQDGETSPPGGFDQGFREPKGGLAVTLGQGLVSGVRVRRAPGVSLGR